jgi:hypothetical protein
MSKYILVEVVAGGAIIRSIKTGESLGHIKLYPKWRKLVFVPDEGTVWSADCLQAIEKKLLELEELRKLSKLRWKI